MVAEEHEHHGGIARVQLLRQTDIFADRFIHAEEVVVEHITALLRPAACFGRNIGNGALRFGVGAVILIAHREGEQRRAVRRVEVGEQVVRELLVGMPHGDVGVDQLAEAVFRENAPVKAEVVVHALAVIEPAVAGVRVVRRIALRREVADVGADRAAVFVVLARAGEEAPLGIHGAAREDVREQAAGEALLLERVPGGIDLLHRVKAGEGVKVGQVAERLEHHAHDGDLLPLRNVFIGEGRKQRLRRAGIVALRLFGEQLRHRVQEGKRKAAGKIDLVVRPDIDERVVRRPFVDGFVGVGAEVRADAQQHAGRRAQRADAPALIAARHEEHGKGQHRAEERDRRVDLGGPFKSVLTHDAARRAQEQDIARAHRIAAQHDLIIVDEWEAHTEKAAEQHAAPAASGQKIAQPCEQQRREKVQRQQQRMIEIGPVQLCLREGGIRAGREPQAEKADADAEEREQHGEVGAVGAERPAARAIGRKNKARKLQIGFPFKKNNRIITDFSAKTTAISHHSAKSRSM